MTNFTLKLGIAVSLITVSSPLLAAVSLICGAYEAQMITTHFKGAALMNRQSTATNTPGTCNLLYLAGMLDNISGKGGVSGTDTADVILTDTDGKTHEFHFSNENHGSALWFEAGSDKSITFACEIGKSVTVEGTISGLGKPNPVGSDIQTGRIEITTDGNIISPGTVTFSTPVEYQSRWSADFADVHDVTLLPGEYYNIPPVRYTGEGPAGIVEMRRLSGTGSAEKIDIRIDGNILPPGGSWTELKENSRIAAGAHSTNQGGAWSVLNEVRVMCP
ncbi:hypothetical protein UXO11_22340 [Enterobacter wuhouensis]|uniref:hypothetical protein n=1 Tax=Enterobacter wuhouensis TaxID=2529381 RepID=UPI002FD53980